MNIIQRFHDGGVFMYPILIFGVCTLGLMIERLVTLYVTVKMPAQDYRKNLLNFISRGDLIGAESYAKTAGAGTALGEIVTLGIHLRSNAAGEEELQARLDEKLASSISGLDRRTGFLGMFGNVATLMGLLGTISGMIQSFAAVATASASDRATLLSKGISEAMNCTAFGLIVAIPALIAYAVFQNRTDRFVTRMTETTTEVFNDLLFLTEGEVQTTGLTGRQAQAVNGHSTSKARQPMVEV